MENSKRRLSDYVEGLPDEAKSRYKDKISLINGLDPFSSDYCSKLVESESYPPLDSCDLLSYLVLKTSFLTLEQFRARKGLDAYNQFVSGWVKEIKTWSVSGKYLTVGRVSNCFLFTLHHYQKQNTPLQLYQLYYQ